MARRATSLGPKPSLLHLFCFVFCVFFICFFCLFCLFLFVFVCFLFLVLLAKKPVFPPKKGHFLCIFSVSSFVSL